MPVDSSIEEVLEKCSPQIRQLAEELRKLVYEAAPEAGERAQIGWGTISYTHNGIFCYIQPHRNWVSLGFYRGVDLSDPEGLLEGTGKALRHMKVRTAEHLRRDSARELVKQAFNLGGGRAGTGKER